MIAHEAVMSRLAWMLGPGAHEVIPPACEPTGPVGRASELHQPSLRQSVGFAGYVWDEGMSGQALHGGPEPAAGYSGSFGFDSAARQFHTDQVNVAWQLSDVGPSDGGFVSLSHDFTGAFGAAS